MPRKIPLQPANFFKNPVNTDLLENTAQSYFRS